MTLTRTRYALGFCCVLLSVAACSSTQSGTPEPGGQLPTTGGSSAAVPSSAAPTSGSPDVDPCSFLPPDQARELGVPVGKPGVSSPGSVGCNYKGTPGFTVAYYSRTRYDAKIAKPRPVTINSGAHRAVQDDKEPGCVISMELGESTSVAVIAVNTQLSHEQDCQVAKLAAQAIEPNLPQG